MEDVRKLVPRTPPEGFLAWAANVLSGELDTHGLLYEQEWVEDWGLEVMLDEYARPRKRRMVRVQCSCCGHQDLYHYGRGQRGYGFILPESFTEVEGGTVYEDGDIMLCPQCGCQVQVRRRSALRQKGWFVPTWGRAMSAAVVGEGRFLALTGWVIQRRVLMGGGDLLAAIPAITPMARAPVENTATAASPLIFPDSFSKSSTKAAAITTGMATARGAR